MPLSRRVRRQETATNLWRNRIMALAAILTVAVSLSLVGTALLLRQAVNRQIGQWSSNVQPADLHATPTASTQQIADDPLDDQPDAADPHSCTYLDHEQSYSR